MLYTEASQRHASSGVSNSAAAKARERADRGGGRKTASRKREASERYLITQSVRLSTLLDLQRLEELQLDSQDALFARKSSMAASLKKLEEVEQTPGLG